ncbi:MAG: leucine-rich repeat domain-containing protein [Alistipes sp.]|nr:leucine-rich repeat domain-containing protein [Alistipes sp.]
MKKFLFAAVALLLGACTTDTTKDIAVEVPEILTVSFDEDSRIQLSDGKTVWTRNDLVSVFYRSDANQKWQFQGNTGDRSGNIKRITAPEHNNTTSLIVIAYPYSEKYYLNPETCNLQAFLPAEQTYKADSYGLDGNIMVSQSEYKQFYLRSVCGWIKIQLSGEGQGVEKITLRGNNGEQVAGEIYINTADATAILAAESGMGTDDTEVGGTMIEDDTILTEVTLNCSPGVTLGEEPTAFYIALPPQTFENGISIEALCKDGSRMSKSTTNSITISRNTIQPMEDIAYVENTEIHYTSTNGNIVIPNEDAFGCKIISNTYEDGKGVITLEGKMTEFGDSAFSYCSSLTSITIPDSVTSIGNYAFSYCSSLTSVTIPESVTYLGTNPFERCSKLAEFNGKFASADKRCLIVDGVLHSFAPAGITEYTIPSGVTRIEDSSFYECSSLEDITIPNGVQSIGWYAFYNCDHLTSISLPNGLTTIEQHAFNRCYNLASVTTPDSLIEIATNSFHNCWNLKSFKGNNSSEDERCLIIDGTLVAFAPAELTEYSIPNGVTAIGDDVFHNCVYLKKITIPNSVTSVGNYSFSYCNNLVSVNIGNGLTEIGNSAFNNCANLVSINIPEGVTSIGGSTFARCSSLSSITLPSTLSSFTGGSVFKDCTNLTSVYCEAVNPPYCSIELFSNEVTVYVYPQSIETYKAAWNSDYCTFESNGKTLDTTNTTTILYTTTDSNTIDMPNWVVKSNTYSNGVGTVVTYGKLTAIARDIFRNCTTLKSVVIPTGVTVIDSSAFYGCTALESVTIPESVTEIGSYVFYNCSALKEFNGKFASADKRCLIKNNEIIAFAPAGVTAYTIPEVVTAIGDAAFAHCYDLADITLPQGLLSIGSSAFRSTAIKGITIPESVTTLGSSAFNNCRELKSVYCKPTTPPTTGSYLFTDTHSDLKITVSLNSVCDYKHSTYWSEYTDRIYADTTEMADDYYIYGECCEYTTIDKAVALTRGTTSGVFSIKAFFYQSSSNIIKICSDISQVSYPCYALADYGRVVILNSASDDYIKPKIEANGVRELTIDFNNMTWSWARITNKYAMPDYELVKYPTKEYIARDGSMKTWMVRHMAWDGGNIYPKLGSGMVKHTDTGTTGTGGYAAADFPTSWNDATRFNSDYETLESGFGVLETYSDDGRIYTYHEMLGYEARNGIGYARYETGPWKVGEKYTDARGTTYTIAEAPLKAQIDQYTGDNAKDEELYPMLRVQAQGICPYGWHVANAADWLDLFYAMSQASKTGTHTYPVAEADCTYKQMINGGVPNINGWLRNTKDWGNQYVDEGADEFGFNYYPLGFRYMTQGFRNWSMRAQLWVPLPMASSKPADYPSAGGGRINLIIKNNSIMTTALTNIDIGQGIFPFRCVKNYK